MPFITGNEKSLFYSLTPQTSDLDCPNTTLFIHGLGSSHSFYHTVIPQIAKKSTCIALDTPGSGLSSLGGPAQTAESIVEDAMAVMDAIQSHVSTKEFWVVGHSMGGMIACKLAVSYPERVRGLALLGPVSPSPALSDVFSKRIAVVEKDGVEALADFIPFAATGANAKATQRAFIRSLILGTTTAGYASLCNVIAAAAEPDYAKIEVPLMILAGGDDKTSPYEGCKKIYDSVSTASSKKVLEKLPGVGHWHAIEAADLVARDISGFIVSMDQVDDRRKDMRATSEP